MSGIVNSSQETFIDCKEFHNYQELFNTQSDLAIQQLESLILKINSIDLSSNPISLIPIQDLISYQASDSEIPVTEVYHLISKNKISIRIHKNHTPYIDSIPLNSFKVPIYSSVFRSNLPTYSHLIYFIGGMSAFGQVSNEIIIFDINTKAYRIVAHMKYERHSCATIGYKSLVFIIGGIGVKGDGNDIIEYFDMSRPDLLMFIETDKRKRTQTSATLFNNKIYIVSENIKLIHVLDPETKTVENMNFYDKNFSLSLVCCWKTLFIIFTNKNKVHIFNQQHKNVKVIDYLDCQTKWTQESISKNDRGIFFVDYVTEDEHEIILEGLL